MHSGRGRLVFLYRGSVVCKNINFDDPGAKLRDEVVGELCFRLLCKTTDIKIFSLADEYGMWARKEDAVAVPGREIAYSRSISSLFPNTESEGRVHFRVEVTTPSSLLPEISTTKTSWTRTLFPCRSLPLFVDHRWQLNEVLVKMDAVLKVSTGFNLKPLNGNRKRHDEGGNYGVASSCIEWGGVENIYDPWMQEDKAAFPVKELDDTFVEDVVTMLQDERKAFGSAKCTTSVRRLQQSITTIFGAVATLFDGKLGMKMKPSLSNDLVFTNGNPDLLVTRKQRKVVVDMCLQEDQLKAQVENLVLLDVVIADNEKKYLQAAPVFGIVSTFSDWVFYKYDKTGIIRFAVLFK